jgi:Ca2+-binding RTX toxin-like protein
VRPRRRSRSRGLLVLAIVAGLASVTALAFTAANGVAPSKASDRSQVVNVNELKPASCNALTLANRVVGSGTFTGTAGADLLLGSAGVDDIRGAGGNDCLVGGAGNDTLRGQAGTDVCIGGPGTDTFLPNCETQIQ